MRSLYPDRGAHSVHQLQAHLVFVTKFRRETIDAEVLQFLRSVFDGVCQDLDCELLTCQSDKDHVHVVVQYPPKIAIAVLVNRLKGVSSYKFHRQGSGKSLNTEGDSVYGQGDEPAHPSVNNAKPAFWAPSYFVKSVGASTLAETTGYLNKQEANRRAKEAAKRKTKPT